MLDFDFTPMISAMDRLIIKSNDDLKDSLSSEGYIEAKATVESIESLENKILSIFEQKKKQLMKEMEGAELDNVLNAILPALFADDITSVDKLTKVFKKELWTVIANLTNAYVKDVDPELAFSTFTDRTSNWIERWSDELGHIMHLDTYNGLESIMSEALKKGESIQKVTEGLADWYGFSTNRARKTALTEILTAHSVASNESYRQSPAVEQKCWRHTGAYKNEPRQNHVAMDGVTIDKNKTFTLYGADGGIYHPEFPRDPILPASERVNCHCILQPIVSKDVLGLSIDEREKLQADAIARDNKAWEKEIDKKNKAKAGI